MPNSNSRSLSFWTAAMLFILRRGDGVQPSLLLQLTHAPNQHRTASRAMCENE